MIGHIKGVVIEKDERSFVLSVGGVGYIVATTQSTIASAAIGETRALHTHLSVREDALDLYGFERKEELAFFKLLIGISGIGPKSALNILSLADLSTIVRAIATGDAGYLTKVSGIGKKLAEKIVLELKEKVAPLAEGDVPHAESEALLALEALGYEPKETREIVRSLSKDALSAQEIIRKALQTLGGRTS